jgi:hypothetical protein
MGGARMVGGSKGGGSGGNATGGGNSSGGGAGGVAATGGVGGDGGRGTGAVEPVVAARGMKMAFPQAPQTYRDAVIAPHSGHFISMQTPVGP